MPQSAWPGLVLGLNYPMTTIYQILLSDYSYHKEHIILLAFAALGVS